MVYREKYRRLHWDLMSSDITPSEFSLCFNCDGVRKGTFVVTVRTSRNTDDWVPCNERLEIFVLGTVESPFDSTFQMDLMSSDQLESFRENRSSQTPKLHHNSWKIERELFTVIHLLFISDQDVFTWLRGYVKVSKNFYLFKISVYYSLLLGLYYSLNLNRRNV